MKKILVAGLVILTFGVVLTLYPTVNEDASGVCHALEKRVVAGLATNMGAGRSDAATSRAVLGALVTGLSEGAIAARVVKREYPNLPPLIGCTAVYWRVVFDPSAITRLETGLPR